MLAPLETLLLTAVQAAHPAGTEILVGPAMAPGDAQHSRIALYASSLTPQPLAEGENPLRDPAWRGWRGSISAEPDQPLDYLLPAAATGSLQEVQSPAGRILARGDAWQLDGNILHFYRPPSDPVHIRMRDAPCAGYSERRPASLTLQLLCWAPDIASADQLLASSLSALLARLQTLDVIELSDAAPQLELRLSKPRAQLQAIQRQRDAASCLSRLDCRIDGELEMTLRLGEPEAVGVIQSVEIALQR